MSILMLTTKRSRFVLLLLASLLLAAGQARTAAAQGAEQGIWNLSLENSSITPTSPSDRNYTNGIGIGWTSPPIALLLTIRLLTLRVFLLHIIGLLLGRI